MIYINALVIILLLLNAIFFESNTHSTKVYNNKREFIRLENDFSNKIDTFFTNRFKRGSFNGAVLFADSGRIVYEKAFGYSNFLVKDSLKTSSIFQLASVSKQFTAFAVMVLKEKGLLDYSDNVKKYFPDFPYEGITIRHLLTHSSGLPNYMHFAEEFWKDKKIYLTNTDVINELKEFKPEICFKPGTRFMYSNTGYCLLASIIEATSGMPYNQFMETNIFRPLGMYDTFVFNYDTRLKDQRIALGHTAGKRLEPFHYQSGVIGDKGIYSTLKDLLIWDQALYNCEIMNNSILDEAFIPAFSNSKSKRNYGYGWRIKMYGKNKIVYHGGWWKGYRSYFIRSINDHKTIIILINTAARVPFKVDNLLELFGISNSQNT